MGLANAYIDMGNWCGFTPFIGAGIGFATLTVDGMKDVNVPAPGSVAFGADHTKTNFAYAFYAGGSFDVTPQVALELTYRYADLGTAQSGRVTDLRRRSFQQRRLRSRHHLQRCDARHALQVPARSRRLSAGEVTGRRRPGAAHETSPGPSAGPAFTAPASIEAA